MSQPQLTTQQLEHAISAYQKRVEAKRLEVESFAGLRDTAQAVVADLMDLTIPQGDAAPDYQDRLRLSLVNLFSAKYTVASLDLEEMELQLKALRQMSSGVVGANMVIPPFNSKRN
jgi:hypothetical protein